MLLDNSYKETFHQCPRKYYFKKFLHLAPEKGSNALRYGSTYHAMKEGFLNYVIENGWDHLSLGIAQGMEYGKKTWDALTKEQEFIDDYRTFENCGDAFVESIQMYIADKNTTKVLQAESIFECPISISPKEKEIYPHIYDVIFTGKMDAQVELSGIPWIVEFKTTGQNLQTQSERLYRSSQLIGYSYVGKYHLGFPTMGVLVDFHQIYSRRKKDGSYGKITMNFDRVPQIFAAADLLDWRGSFLYTANAIEHCTNTGYFPPEFGSCHNYGRCPFLDICESGNAEVLEEGEPPPGYIIKKDTYLKRREDK